MTKKRKRLTLTVDVTVPLDMTAAEAKREVRTLINHQSGYSTKWDDGAVKAVRVGASRSRSVT